MMSIIKFVITAVTYKWVIYCKFQKMVRYGYRYADNGCRVIHCNECIKFEFNDLLYIKNNSDQKRPESRQTISNRIKFQIYYFLTFIFVKLFYYIIVYFYLIILL